MPADQPDLQSIIQRLQRVERQNRQLKCACLLIATLICSLLLMGQARPNRVIEAEKFVLKDETGLVRAQIGTFEGNAVFTLWGPKGSKTKGTMAEIGAGPTGSFMYLFDEQANGLMLSALSGNESLKISDKNGSDLLSLFASGSGGSLFFGTPDKKIEAFLAANPTNSTLMFNGTDGGSLLLDGNSLQLADRDGFATHIGQTPLITTNTGEKHTTSAASVVLFGKEGKVIWSAP